MHWRPLPHAPLLLMLAVGLSLPAAASPGYWEVTDTAGLLKAVGEVTGEGGTIVLRPGYYMLDAEISFKGRSHITLVGSGWDTVIQRRGAGNVLVFEDCAFCAVRNMLIGGDAQAADGSGIVFRGNCSSNVVDFCRINGFAVSGVRYEGIAATPQSSNTLSNCHLIDNGVDQLYSSSNNDFYIIGNQYGAHQRQGETAPRSGAALLYSSAGTYSMNYHWGNRVALRLGPGANFNRIENNRFENSYEQGVLIGDPAGGRTNALTIFTGNTIHTNSMSESGKYAALEAYDAHDFIFSANQVFSWDSDHLKHKSSLVLARNCVHWIVKDNTFRHNTGPAVVAAEDGAHLVKDNMGE